MPMKTKAPAKPPIPPKPMTYPTLGGAALDAVCVIGEVLLDNDIPDARRWQLDAAQKALWSAIRTHQAWERTVLAQPITSVLKDGTAADLGPIAATCAACGDQALIIPQAKGPGLAICRRCSFEDRTIDEDSG